jgi:hypothetical protein
VHLGVERPSLHGVSEWRERFRVLSLLGEGDTEVERGVRILRATVENHSKRALGLGKLILLQRLPSFGEARVHTRHRRRSCVVMRGFPWKAGHRDREERSDIHAVSRFAFLAPRAASRATFVARTT